MRRPYIRARLSEDLLSVQHQVEALAFLFLAHTQTDQRLGDHQQDQRPDAAIDQCRGDALALDPQLRQAAGGCRPGVASVADSGP